MIGTEKNIQNFYKPYKAVHAWLITSRQTDPDLECKQQ